jgi:hypothetical protein
MDRKRATIVFSIIAVAAIAGTSIPLDYLGNHPARLAA